MPSQNGEQNAENPRAYESEPGARAVDTVFLTLSPDETLLKKAGVVV